MKKRVYDILKEMTIEHVIEIQSRWLLEGIGISDRILKVFGDKPFKEFLEFLKEEIINHYNWLMKFEPYIPKSGEIVYLVEDREARWVRQGFGYLCVPEKYKGDPEAPRYDMEGASVSYILSFIIETNDEWEIDRLINFVFYETWYMWSGSKLKPIINPRNH